MNTMALPRTGFSMNWALSLHNRPLHCRRRNAHSIVMKSSEDGEKVDWDTAWSRFKRSGTRNSQQKTTEPPPRFNRRTTSPLDAIRKEEDRVLGVWSSTAFSQIGVALLVVLLLVVLADGAPSDARCTLPWCS